MAYWTRRGFAILSLGGLSAASLPWRALGAPMCAVGGMPALLPNQLAVDCASRQNFQLFRQYSDYVGLAGVVSMIDARGPGGLYRSGSLYLFPWLKPKGQAQRRLVLRAAFPAGGSSTVSKPIPNAHLPQDEYLCRYVLQAPWQSFIGFLVDTPIAGVQGRAAWVSNIPRLADGESVGVDWTSSNLNRSWFGGASSIPDSDTCNGNAWRALITEGLNEVSVGAC